MFLFTKRACTLCILTLTNYSHAPVRLWHSSLRCACTLEGIQLFKGKMIAVQFDWQAVSYLFFCYQIILSCCMNVQVTETFADKFMRDQPLAFVSLRRGWVWSNVIVENTWWRKIMYDMKVTWNIFYSATFLSRVIIYETLLFWKEDGSSSCGLNGDYKTNAFISWKIQSPFQMSSFVIQAAWSL